MSTGGHSASSASNSFCSPDIAELRPSLPNMCVPAAETLQDGRSRQVTALKRPTCASAPVFSVIVRSAGVMLSMLCSSLRLPELTVQ